MNAFAEVYNAHFDFVWASLRRLGVSEAETPDATQEVFLVVHRKLAGFEGRSKVTTWLYGICLHVASARRRLAHARYEVASDPFAVEPLDERIDVAADAERSQGLSILEQILGEMSLEQRAVFTLFELDERSGDQIAELLGVPLGTVYSRLRLAREVFRNALARRRAHETFRDAAVAGGAPR